MNDPSIDRAALLAAVAAMVRACQITTAELAEVMPQPPAGSASACSPSDRQVLQLADREAGCTIREVQDLLHVLQPSANARCQRLTEAGELHRIKAPGEPGFRYFRQLSHAMDWVNAAAPPSPTKRDQIVALAQAEDGVTVDDVVQHLGGLRQTARASMVQLEQAGRLFRAAHATPMRMFATQAAARAWARDNAPPPSPVLFSADATPPALANGRGKEMTITEPAAPIPVAGVPDFSRAKVTVCPSPAIDARYQLQPDLPEGGGFMAEWRAKRAGGAS